jgi:hypothetical protein
MPTYDYRCATCGRLTDTFMSIREYADAPPTFVCCAVPMERFFTSPRCPLLSMLANDRHYQDLMTLDGVDVSSRAKHQAYMKEKGVTTMDDFSQTWARAARDRADATQGLDATRRADIDRAIEQIKAR